MYEPTFYTIASSLFLQLLGIIYFFVFVPFLFQIRGLIGVKGILPAESYLQFIKSHLGKRCYLKVPTVFWISAKDSVLLFVVVMGCLLSILLALGVYPFILLPLLYILYLSIIHVGQDFLSFGWELFLMELTANAFFLSLTNTPNPFVWISINLLLFRFHIQAGAVKLQSRDPNWRNLTALCYHYQTQPLPNTVAWFIHRMPVWFHKLSCLFMFFVELVVPFAIFGGEEFRFAAFICLFGLQFFIWLTGNLSYLNHMTAVFSLILVSNTFLTPFFGEPSTVGLQDPLAITLFASLAGITLFTLQLMQLWHHFFPNSTFENILHKIRPFFIINRYGIFAVMTTKRHEIVIEGSADGITWTEYIFKYKPSEVTRRPRRISPIQPRLDWQVWFLPFSSYETNQWFQRFLYKLLKGEPYVESLLRENPFKEAPPKFIRAMVYDYTFTDFATKKESGAWWNRKRLGPYSPVLSLKK